MQEKSVINRLQVEIKQLKDKLQQSNDAFLNVIGKNRDGILIFDQNGKVLYANPAALALFDKEVGELVGEYFGIFADTEDKTEITIVHKSRGPISVEVNIAATTWNNQSAMLASLRDVTEHKRTKSILRRLSHFDYLTNLANRVAFEETLSKSLARSDRTLTKLALLFLDMDGFKSVNDTYGHLIGDKLLVKSAHLLNSCIRREDTVARLGGDEFAIIVERIESISDCEQIAKDILTKIKHVSAIEDNNINVNFSIGIAIYPDQAHDKDELIKNADTAMYAAKNAGKGCYMTYDKDAGKEKTIFQPQDEQE